MSFDIAIKTVFTKYAEFTGRAGRAEFWWWVLFIFLTSAAIGTLDAIYMSDGTTRLGQLLQSIWSIVILLPNLAVTVRRLRDAGYHWAHLFWVLVPVVGWIILLVFLAQPSKTSH